MPSSNDTSNCNCVRTGWNLLPNKCRFQEERLQHIQRSCSHHFLLLVKLKGLKRSSDKVAFGGGRVISLVIVSISTLPPGKHSLCHQNISHRDHIAASPSSQQICLCVGQNLLPSKMQVWVERGVSGCYERTSFGDVSSGVFGAIGSAKSLAQSFSLNL